MQRRKPLTRRTGLKARSAFRTGAKDAGETLWSALQGHSIARFGFRHHERIGPFVVDIVCPGARLVLLIEDGHGSSEREQWLEAAGYSVKTYTHAEAANPSAVLEEIARAFELRAVR